jgi:hypothetical protein
MNYDSLKGFNEEIGMIWDQDSCHVTGGSFSEDETGSTNQSVVLRHSSHAIALVPSSSTPDARRQSWSDNKFASNTVVVSTTQDRVRYRKGFKGSSMVSAAL